MRPALETTLFPPQSVAPPEDDDTWTDRASDFFNIYDTQSFVAANDDAVLVVFRGTSDIKDWITNLRAAPWRVPAEWEWDIGTEGQVLSMHRVSDLAGGKVCTTNHP